MLDLVRTTLACTDQLRRTVDGILDLNKMEEGKLELQQSWFRVPNVMRTVLNQVSKALGLVLIEFRSFYCKS
jgi:K+-sensing histidine kinase KdpD